MVALFFEFFPMDLFKKLLALPEIFLPKQTRLSVDKVCFSLCSWALTIESVGDLGEDGVFWDDESPSFGSDCSGSVVGFTCMGGVVGEDNENFSNGGDSSQLAMGGSIHTAVCWVFEEGVWLMLAVSMGSFWWK